MTSSRGPLLGYYNETGDDFIDSYQLRALFTGPFVEHHSRISDVSRGIRNRLEIKQWRRVREIGRGGFGTVHLETERGGAVRAVKEIPKYTHKTRTMDHLREILAMAHFSAEDTFFIRLYGWFQNHDFIFIAMEYAPHGDLEECVKENLPEPEVQTIAMQLIEALTLMHQKNFTHRDLKPSNVFVVSKGPAWWLKLGDFGVSKRVRDNSTSMHTSIETEYTAPEISGFVGDGSEESSKYTNAVDMWSLGCLLHWLLTQRLPLTNLEGIDFIQKLMAPQPHERMNAFEALKHGWPRECFDFNGIIVQHSWSDAVDGPSSPLIRNPPEDAKAVAHTESLDVRVLDGLKYSMDGKIGDSEGKAVGKIIQGDPTQLDRNEADVNNRGPDLSMLRGLMVEERDVILDVDGKPLGNLRDGDPFDRYGMEIVDNGKLLDEDEKVIGRAEAVPQEVLAKEYTSAVGIAEHPRVENLADDQRSGLQNQLPTNHIQDPSPNPTDDTEDRVLKAFHQFKDNELAKTEEMRRMKARKERSRKLADLAIFAKTFKPKTPVPTDLIPILTQVRNPKSSQDTHHSPPGTDSPPALLPHPRSRGLESFGDDKKGKNRNEDHNTSQPVVAGLPAPSRLDRRTVGKTRREADDTLWPPRPTVSWAAVAAGRPETDNITPIPSADSAFPQGWRHPPISRRSRKGAPQSASSSNQSSAAGRIGTTLSDSPSDIKIMGPGGQKNPTIYVRNLPWITSRDDLFELFRPIGWVSRAEIEYLPDGRSRGTGIVEYQLAENAERAIAMLSGDMYRGRRLDVSYAKFQSEFA